MFIMLLGKKARSGPIPVSLNFPKILALIIVRFVETLYSEAILNLKVDAAGQVFMNPSVKPALFMPKIIRWEWKEPKWCVASANRILVMCLRTALHQPDCDIVSTALCWTFTKHRKRRKNTKGKRGFKRFSGQKSEKAKVKNPVFYFCLFTFYFLLLNPGSTH